VTKSELLAFMRRHPLAVEATVSPEGAPQAAVIGVVVSDELEVFFDTLATSRKYANLKRDPRVALVMGWDLGEGCTLQLEGSAEEPLGGELERLQRLYFATFPDGVERRAWPAIAYVRVRPSWLRFSDFRGAAPTIVEFDRARLDSLG